MLGLLVTLLSTTATIQGQVTVSKDGAEKADRSSIAVYLEGGSKPGPAIGPPPTIAQRGLAFIPEINVVTVGTRIEFPNDDKVYHNVFSVSDAAKFDLGLYKSGERKSVTFTEPGVVDIYCNIHPDMLAKVKVIAAKYYMVTGKDGAYRLTDVVPGHYVLVAWQPWGKEARIEFDVKDNDALTKDLHLVEGTKSKRHLRKDGTPYGRYK